MQRILVTGGAGFMGSNFVKYVLRHREDVQVFVLNALTYAGNLENFTQEGWDNPRFFFWEGDVRDRDIVAHFTSQVDAVVHFAAQTHVDNSISRTDAFIDTDVKGTQILLDAVKSCPVERFIHISTSEVYGTAEAVPMTEEHPLKARSPYASAKLGADRLVYSYFATFELPVVILRPFNNYGPYQHTEKVIPCFVTRALQNKPLHGEGTASRDWLYVQDLCEAIDLTLQADIQAVAGEVINLGTGVDTNVLEITHRILDKLGKPKSLIKHLPDRPGQVYRHVSSTEKAKELLGWEAKTPFWPGLNRTIDWYVEHPNWWKNLRMFSDDEEEPPVNLWYAMNGLFAKRPARTLLNHIAVANGRVAPSVARV